MHYDIMYLINFEHFVLDTYVKYDIKILMNDSKYINNERKVY